MNFEKLKDKIKNIELPGFEAHKEMLPSIRPYNIDTSEYTKSAVNIVMFKENDFLKFILTKRSSKLQHHAGQISLPGGSFDNEDKNLWETAKRETYEEIGLKINDTNFVKQLSSIPVPISKFVVYPFVCFVDFVPQLKINLEEVEKVFLVEIDSFFSHDNIKNAVYKSNNNSFDYKYYALENEQVWGLTAMVLSEFNFILNY